jgi:hypothetical protein
LTSLTDVFGAAGNLGTRCDFCGSVSSDSQGRACCQRGATAAPRGISPGGQQIASVDDWFAACPPKGGLKQWKDGFSAKESANSWFRSGRLEVPVEVGELLDSVPELQDFRLATVVPELCTKLDDYRQGRNADAVAMGLAGGRRTLIAIEAKAAEDFGPQIGARLRYALAHTRVPLRIDGLARAVFGRSVTTLDPVLADLRYQLLHALAGTGIEAQNRGADQAVFVVQHFPNPRRLSAETFSDFAAFVRALVPGCQIAPGRTVQVRVQGSDAIPAGMPLFVGWATAQSPLAAEASQEQ